MKFFVLFFLCTLEKQKSNIVPTLKRLNNVRVRISGSNGPGSEEEKKLFTE